MTGRSARGRRDNSDPEATRREILQAALEVLARDGPENLNVTEVARRAGVNRGTAYQHFPTREDLVHATTSWVSERMYEAFYGDMGDLWDEGQVYPPDLATERLADFAMNNPELSRAWLFDVMATEGAVTDRFWQKFVAELKEFVARGYGRADIDIEVYAFIVLSSAFLWPIWAGAHGKGVRSRQKMQQRFIDEMMRLVMFGALVPERHEELRERLRARRAPPA